MTRLTKVEKEALWNSIEHAFLDTTTHSMGDEEAIDRAVERILTARLAPIWALADEWDAYSATDEWHAADCWHAAPEILRAALGGTQ